MRGPWRGGQLALGVVASAAATAAASQRLQRPLSSKQACLSDQAYQQEDAFVQMCHSTSHDGGSSSSRLAAAAPVLWLCGGR